MSYGTQAKGSINYAAIRANAAMLRGFRNTAVGSGEAEIAYHAAHP